METISKRCLVCGNLDPYCSCRDRARPTVPIEPGTDWQKQRDAIMGARQGGSTAEPTPLEFVMHALRYDPEQDGLYLCGKCGVTYDDECAYGGWHDVSQHLHVTLGP